jgi:hypothetical protein
MPTVTVANFFVCARIYKFGHRFVSYHFNYFYIENYRSSTSIAIKRVLDA